MTEPTNLTLKDKALTFIQPAVDFWNGGTANKLVVGIAAYWVYSKFGVDAYDLVSSAPDMALEYVCGPQGSPVSVEAPLSGTITPQGAGGPQESF